MIQIIQTTFDKTKIKDSMMKMENSSHHLLGIVNDILDFSKIESGKLALEESQFSLHQDIDFIDSMFRDRARNKRLNLHIELNDIKNDGITTDRLRLNQVLINLLSNAIKFTPENGMVKLTVSELAHIDGESVYRFSVRDNGIGIGQEQAKKLFTPFTQAYADTTKLYGGTGLGLSISQNIVRMMGGEIELETEPSRGSIFLFTIKVPAEKNAVEIKKVTNIPDISQKLENKRVLVVDDIEINREIVISMLDDNKAEIETASNGMEALDKFCDSGHNQYDLILMDMQMPVMDGCTATERIRNSDIDGAQDVKIIAMTANILPQDMKKAYNAGMDGYVSKPIEMEKLYTSMEELL